MGWDGMEGGGIRKPRHIRGAFLLTPEQYRLSSVSPHSRAEETAGVKSGERTILGEKRGVPHQANVQPHRPMVGIFSNRVPPCL